VPWQFAHAGVLLTRSPLLMLGATTLADSAFALNAIVFGSVGGDALGLTLRLSVTAISFYMLVAAASS
jgi:hypothetical protein